jgi:AcrR family transcriptional regulator
VSTTRDRIIQATTALFMQRGYAASGLKDISLAGEAPIGSLYHFFPGGKEELAGETLRAAGSATKPSWKRYSTRLPTP